MKNILFLESIIDLCSNTSVLKVFKIIKTVFLIIRISAIILLLISLMHSFAEVITNKSEDALSKTLTTSVVKIVAVILIILMPTFINLITSLASNDSYISCWNIATSENIDEIIIEEAREALAKAQETRSSVDIGEAANLIGQIEDEDIKEELSNQLNEIDPNIVIPNNPSEGNDDPENNIPTNKEKLTKTKSGVDIKFGTNYSIRYYTNEDSCNIESINGKTIDTTKCKKYTSDLRFLMHVPENSTKNMTLIIFLHGNGSIKNSKANLINYEYNPIKLISNNGKSDKFLILEPHLNTDISWNDQTNNVISLIKLISEEYYVDMDNIIIVGHSAGSSGASRIAGKLNGEKYFSKLVMISGHISPTNSELNNLSGIKIFTGENDTVVDKSYLNNVAKRCEEIKKELGSDIVQCFLNVENKNHDSIIKEAFNNSNLNWMLQK